jgi:antitoxin ParD1/3/4
MATMTLELPEPLVEFAEECALRGGYPSAEAYVLDLLRAAHKAAAKDKERIRELLRDGINSGEPIEADEAFWEEHLRRYDERHPETTD